MEHADLAVIADAGLVVWGGELDALFPVDQRGAGVF